MRLNGEGRVPSSTSDVTKRGGKEKLNWDEALRGDDSSVISPGPPA